MRIRKKIGLYYNRFRYYDPSLGQYTLCSGIICEELNGSDYMAIPLKETEKMRIGYVKRKGAKVSHIGEIYIEELKKYRENVM